jgi:hypothetical protein
MRLPISELLIVLLMNAKERCDNVAVMGYVRVWVIYADMPRIKLLKYFIIYKIHKLF